MRHSFHKKQKNKINRVLRGILAEIAADKGRVSQVQPSQNKLIDELNGLLANYTKAAARNLLDKASVIPLNLSTNAYDSAKYAGVIPHFDYDVVTTINRYYNEVNEVKNTEKRFFDVALSAQDPTKDHVNKLLTLLVILRSQEKDFIEIQEQVLNELTNYDANL